MEQFLAGFAFIILCLWLLIWESLGKSVNVAVSVGVAVILLLYFIELMIPQKQVDMEDERFRQNMRRARNIVSNIAGLIVCIFIGVNILNLLFFHWFESPTFKWEYIGIIWGAFEVLSYGFFMWYEKMD
ncbi:MAG: hypothetical protein K6G11_02220 [Lachnospiraceae bacterium]|nr:hypothetical protein [Lachnospiraceae bacterium]